MIRNYIKTVVRNILRHKGYSFINISGQAIGMACCMLIFIWVNNEQSYDRFHEHANNIHRVVINWPQGMQTEWAPVIPPPLAAALKSEIPEVHDAETFCTQRRILVEYEQKRFTEEVGVRKVLGASEAGIFFLLSRSFVRWVLTANLIAWPVAYYVMSRWLQTFAFRAGIGWATFILSRLISLAVAILTVSYQSLKIARSNPVKALRYE